MNNPAGLSQLDMLAMSGLLAGPTNRRALRSKSRGRTGVTNINRSKRRKKNKTARRSRARNRS